MIVFFLDFQFNFVIDQMNYLITYLHFWQAIRKLENLQNLYFLREERISEKMMRTTFLRNFKVKKKNLNMYIRVSGQNVRRTLSLS